MSESLAMAERLESEFSETWLDVDARTGLPVAIGRSRTSAPLRVRATMLVGGIDRRGPEGEMVYDGAVERSDIATTGSISDYLVTDARVYAVPVALAGWRGTVMYRLSLSEPAVTWTFRWSPGPAAESIRDFVLSIGVDLAAGQNWVINAPGTQLRAGAALDDLGDSHYIPSIGGTAGSLGMVAVTSPEATLVIWPRSKDENGTSELSRTLAGVRLLHSTRLAAFPVPGGELVWDGIALDLLDLDWQAIGSRVPEWIRAFGIATPEDRPEWVRGTTIFEAQIGISVFAGGSWSYSPYPELSDLRRDLPRIKDLGFDTIQLMPRQPFPSYNIIDFDDITTTYGPEDELIEIVEWCHDNGMHLILDILMHGVIDQESVEQVAEAVRTGPWYELATAGQAEIDARQLQVYEHIRLSWSRHILDFERAWHDNSPRRHPLADEQPDWFCRDSSGRIVGIYTKAIDQSNPQWQDYFIEATLGLVRRLQIDGFRFDAPSYNTFPNWTQRTRSRASVQELGALALFRRLRQRLRAHDPQLLIYTEPNGVLWRESMDLNYNYDESWLPDAIFGRGGDHPPARVRNGRELAEWLRDRDRTLPTGSVTAHHIDSHDTFWWPLPSLKWRREQFGQAPATALMMAFALAGGPYLMFVGGEVGMEEEVRQVNGLRATRPELARGAHLFAAVEVDSPDLFVVLHELGPEVSALIVNLSRNELSSAVDLPGDGGGWLDLLHDGARADLQKLLFTPFSAKFLVRT